jgi:alanine racemase
MHIDINKLRTWVEIDRSALSENYLAFRSLLGSGVELMAMVKSNAYGHCLSQCATFFESCGVDWLGVDSISEGVSLRRSVVRTPILVLGYTLPNRILEARDSGLSISISSFESLDSLFDLGFDSVVDNPLRIHVKIDTGMHRQGFFIKDLPRVVRELNRLSGVSVEGVFSHFASAIPSCADESGEQINIFEKAICIFHEAGFFPMRHISATGGVLSFANARFDCVRVGIGMYGVFPSDEVREVWSGREKGSFSLIPALSWKTVVGEVKSISKGIRIGYGWSEGVERDSRIAILPIGYWHGYFRSLSSVGEVLIRGKRAKVLGVVCMDMMVVDVTDIEGVSVGDEVVILGRQGEDEVSAYELAKRAGTIPYEILTCINPLIRRVYM